MILILIIIALVLLVVTPDNRYDSWCDITRNLISIILTIIFASNTGAH